MHIPSDDEREDARQQEKEDRAERQDRYTRSRTPEDGPDDLDWLPEGALSSEEEYEEMRANGLDLTHPDDAPEIFQPDE